jgi:hypothetical protein
MVVYLTINDSANGSKIWPFVNIEIINFATLQGSVPRFSFRSFSFPLCRNFYPPLLVLCPLSSVLRLLPSAVLGPLNSRRIERETPEHLRLCPAMHGNIVPTQMQAPGAKGKPDLINKRVPFLRRKPLLTTKISHPERVRFLINDKIFR